MTTYSLDDLSITEHRNLAVANRAWAETKHANLDRLCDKLREVEDTLDAVLHLNSVVRCPELNAAVGGSNTSAHTDGRAADFTASGRGTPLDVCRLLIKAGVVFDQLIFEGTWVHIAIARNGERVRQMVLTAVFHPHGPTTYQPGLPE